MKPKYKLYLIFFITFSLLALAALAMSSPLFHQEIDAFLKKNEFQGTVLVAKDGKILFQQGYGLANAEYRIPNTTKTVFRIGSITKQFTAVAILQLQEKGMLNVNDSIEKYLPAYPNGERIKIHHLLSHTSGIPSLTEFSTMSEIQRRPSTPQQAIAYFKDLPLKFDPGTDCEYSDSGYIVLGAIIEAVTKMPYADYIEQHIFHPLNMHSTYYEYNHLIIPFRASGYVKKETGIMQHADYIDMSLPHAAGALASTVEDLYKWDRALKEGSLLKKESIDSLFAIQATSAKNKIVYGYGFRIGSQNQGMEGCRNTIVGHFGGIQGFEAASVRYSDDDLTIILLSNVENTDVQSFHKKIAQIFYSSWRVKR